MRASARRCALRYRHAVGVLGAVAAVLGGVATAAASPASASTSRPAGASSGAKSRGVLAGVSCLPSRWCMAVGTSDANATAVAWVWRHGVWRQLDDPPGGGLTGVSCSARTFCMATGIRGS